MGLKRLGGVAGLTLLSCGSEATRPQPEVPVVRSAESVSAPEAPPADPCGPAEAGPTVEDARRSWELGLELLSEGKVDAARCPFERATRTLERVTGAKAEQVMWGPGRPVTERGGLVFYGVETLARAASGDLAFGQALFGVQRVEGGELEPVLWLASDADLDAETLATVGVETGVVQKRSKLPPPSIAPTFEQLSKPFKARLEKGKRVIVPPAPFDVTHDAQGAKLAVLLSGEVTWETVGPFVRDVVVHIVDPSASKVLHAVPLPSSQPSRVSVTLGPKGRALLVCAQSVGGFLVDVKTGNMASLEGTGSDFACDYGTTPFSDDGERVMTRAGLVEVAKVAPGAATTPVFVERLRVGTYELLERAKSRGSFAEAEAEGLVRCRFGPILTPGEVCAARFR
ncbi:MAG: hypothetical protein IPG04_21245 [Polyangiaceae bacterium]|jgi:hypothetical protein|nr:hypothetical protein [Polyangiaceae bacterium]